MFAPSCSCPAGFEGLTCQVNFDDCEDNDCENGATCVDGVNNYTCLCPPLYAGQSRSNFPPVPDSYL